MKAITINHKLNHNLDDEMCRDLEDFVNKIYPEIMIASIVNLKDGKRLLINIFEKDQVITSTLVFELGMIISSHIFNLLITKA